jgi:hypothetical protein
MILRDEEVLTKDDPGGKLALDEVEDVDCTERGGESAKTRQTVMKGSLTGQEPAKDEVGGVTRRFGRSDVSEGEHGETSAGSHRVGRINGKENDPGHDPATKWGPWLVVSSEGSASVRPEIEEGAEKGD